MRSVIIPALVVLLLCSCATTMDKRERAPQVEVSVGEQGEPKKTVSKEPLAEETPELMSWEDMFDKVKTTSFQIAPTTLNAAFQIISQLSGVNVIPGAKASRLRLDFQIKDMDIRTALDVILKANKLDAVTVGKKTILVIPTQEARTYRTQKSVVYYLKSGKGKKYPAIFKQLYPMCNVVNDEDHGALIIIGSGRELKEISKMLEKLDRAEEQVLIELEICEFTTSKIRKVGVESSGDDAYTSVLQTLNPLDKLTLDDFPAVVHWRGEKGTAKLLANPNITVLNKQKATIKIGDRIPLEITTSSIVQGQVAMSTSVQFESVGITVDIEPIIGKNGQVTMDISAEISSVVKTTKEGYPQIGTRKAVTKLRLKDGESGTIGGLIREEVRDKQVGIPFLVEIPLLGRLFGFTTHETVRAEIIMSITPHIIKNE